MSPDLSSSKIKQLSLAEAKEIALWQYEHPYSLYNLSEDPEDIDELMDGSYYSVRNLEDKLIGFFCYGQSAQVPAGIREGKYLDHTALDIGLGMKPNLTGRGLGSSFLSVGLEFATGIKEFQRFRLSVAAFNRRATSLYEKTGFKPIDTFTNPYKGENMEFMIMEKKKE
ncbi:GNAT family N-acetyltransferase [Bacillus horti]|uniref:RimJ/RimL family protein N-acetyltransferase n=1 Tax=Caldalkalibacillus horti TaxID=77523 RepID=A0ABT9VYV2_9BACI|nr:GNAT family N-acetyltransferase [Bacillus horti]MDQ0166180.1 RimJ/RimL family protein N-acetyltransferase [Bacillus horti]